MPEYQRSKTYQITQVGERALQDYQISKRKRFWDMAVKLWIPLFISLMALAVSIYGLYQPVNVRLIK
jgi:hypothetical protein